MKVKNKFYNEKMAKKESFTKHPSTIKYFKKPMKGRTSQKPMNVIALDYIDGKFRYCSGDMMAQKNYYRFGELVKKASRSHVSMVIANDLVLSKILKDFFIASHEEKNFKKRFKNIGLFDYGKFEFEKEPVAEVVVDDYGSTIGVESIFNGSPIFFFKDKKTFSYKKAWAFNFEKITNKRKEYDIEDLYDAVKQFENDFYKIFRCYPNKLISIGYLAKAGVESYGVQKEFDFTRFENKNKKHYFDAFAVATESFGGGAIDSYKYGFTKNAMYADKIAAYLSEVKDLKLLTGIIELVSDFNDTDYHIIRGDVEITFGFDFSPIIIREIVNRKTNIRPSGDFKASYTKKERDFLSKNGGKFKNEVIYRLKTENVKPFENMAKKIIKEKNNGNLVSKLLGNSIYGLTYEGYKEGGAFTVGELFNPFYATLITSSVRVSMMEACVGIEKNGGKVLQILTDSILYKGSKEDFPRKKWTKNRIAGKFEEPKNVSNVLLFGPGRYTFKDENGVETKKARGYDQETNFRELFEKAQQKGKTSVRVKMKTPGTYGLVIDGDTGFENLGKWYYKNRDIDLIVHSAKREIEQFDFKDFGKKLIDTKPPMLSFGMFGDGIVDGTFPHLRGENE